MYTCFTKYAEKDNYDYSTSPYNYEGTTLGDDDDEDITPVRTSKSSNLRTNLALIMAICLSLLNY